MVIKIAKNYDEFRFIKGNRPIVKAKVDKLVKTVEEGLNLFQYCPVLVNKDMYVIDGQHRLEACKALNLPVYYCVIDNISLTQIAKMNSSQNKWKIDDFFNCFIQNGSHEYKTLMMFREKYEIPVSTAVQLLMGGNLIEGGSRYIIDFQEGMFKVKFAEKAEKLMKAVYDYQDVAEKKVLTNRTFIRAIDTLLKSTDYDHQDIVQSIIKKKCAIEKSDSYKEYIYQIEELYNKGRSIRKIIYNGVKKQ